MGSSLYYVFVFIGTAIFCVGLVFLLKKPFYNLSTTAVKQVDILLDRSIGEGEKNRYILRNLATLLKYLLLNIGIFILLLLLSILPVYFYLKYTLQAEADTSSISFYLCLLLGSFSFLIFRRKTDYSYWSKLLHTLILDNYNLGIYLFEREIKRAKKNTFSAEKSFVIVTGLARGGTTALTNLLFDETVFHSIKYSNMPFLLAPNFWKKIYNPKTSKKKVRAHGDKVLFGENSIEALEEYFFKAFLKDSYIHKSNLNKHEITEELLVKYYSYQILFRKNENTIYLAKNNNFLLRYESILEQNKQFKLVLIVREPLEHAKSLLRQHENFLKLQKEDEFVLKYMNWLGHYEFGMNQKSFQFDDDKLSEKYTKSELSYWLASWISYYSEVTKLVDKHTIYLISYEDLLNNPDGLKKALEISLEIKLSKESQELFNPKKYFDENLYEVNKELLEKANKIYLDLMLKTLVLNENNTF